MNAQELIQLRLRNHRLGRATLNTPGQVVEWLGAMQAQDYRAVRWAVGLRLRNGALIGVEEAMAAGSPLRTWLLRGTLHLVAPADIRWMLDLLAPRLIAGHQRRYRQLELEAGDFQRSFAALSRALEQERILTRAAALEVIEQAGVSTAGQRGYHILSRAGLEGLICFGPQQNREQTFMRLSARVPPGDRLDREDALAALARRYFTGHGPAALEDFIWWSGLTVRDARTALELASPDLEQVTVGEVEYWLAPGAITPADSGCPVHLLPAFDEYFLGYRVRDLVLNPQFNRLAVSNNGVFRPILVVDGQVKGTWKQADKHDTVQITVKPFETLNRKVREELATEARQYGAFLGQAVKLIIDST